MAVEVQPWRLGHRPALDGIRGIAILLVLAGHVAPHRLVNGGAVGVTVFFALSGFLITSLLLQEHRDTGRTSFRRFYSRRARRLLPALLVYLAFWTALSASGAGPYRVVPREVFAALFYCMNWILALHVPVSQPMAITWSLSVEEQFYLLWPLTFIAARRWPALPWAVAGFGTQYAVLMRVVSWGADGSHGSIYYRTDTRMDSLLIGCLVALAVHGRGLPRRATGLAPASMVLLVVLLVLRSDAIRYVLEPFLVAIATTGLIVASLIRDRRWLILAPLRWFGRRSYALYLWHYPLVVMAWPGIGVLPMWLAIVLALIAAEASWWLVERPVRRRFATRSDPRSELQPATATAAA